MKNLLVIDGNSILNRQYYGIRPLTTSTGLFTNAVYGFMNVLLNQIEKLEPDYIAVAFDVHAPTFRHKEFADYKAGRHATPTELLQQFPYAKKCASALGITVVEKEGYEADDILGTFAKTAENENDIMSYILTGDRDSFQLISDRTVVLYATNSDTVIYDEKAFFDKYGVKPSQFVDMKALMGDASDNIPGVTGIGEKTASKLISEFKDLDGVYNSLDQLKKGKVTDNLAADKEKAYLSRFLAKIVTDAPLGISLEDIKRKEIRKQELREVLTELEFNGFIKRLGLNETDRPQIARRNVSESELLSLKGEIALLIKEDSFEFYNGGDILVWDASKRLPNGYFDSTDRLFITHDLKGVLHRLDSEGINGFNCIFDTMLSAYVLNPSENVYTVERISTAYLGRQCDDVSAVYELRGILDAKMKEMASDKLFYDIELPLASVLFKMEKRGMLIDKNGVTEYGKELEEKAEMYAGMIYDAAGHDFNISSPKQLGVVLFEELKLPSGKKTKSGYSTAADVLDKLRGFYPIVDMVLEYRQLMKLKSTYADGLPAAVKEDGRIHTSFNQTVTATGRLSSTEPNLQNIPIRTEAGSRLREYFIAPNGYLLIDADYSQIELRLLAHISGDRNMIEGFKSGDDIHRITASQVFNVPPEEVTPELRKRAKAVNFGIVYGIGEYSLAQDLHISMRQAADYINAYKRKYVGVTNYLSKVVDSAYENGYVTTMLGRRRYIPELTATQASVRSFGERVAMNSPIQGSAADIIKIAMIETEKELNESGLDARLVMQVHDELIVEASEKDAAEAAEILKKCMESAADLSVKLSVEVNTGKNWLECH